MLHASKTFVKNSPISLQTTISISTIKTEKKIGYKVTENFKKEILKKKAAPWKIKQNNKIINNN